MKENKKICKFISNMLYVPLLSIHTIRTNIENKHNQWDSVMCTPWNICGRNSNISTIGSFIVLLRNHLCQAIGKKAI